jgi:hypothetical protein
MTTFRAFASMLFSTNSATALSGFVLRKGKDGDGVPVVADSEATGGLAERRGESQRGRATLGVGSSKEGNLNEFAPTVFDAGGKVSQTRWW